MRYDKDTRKTEMLNALADIAEQIKYLEIALNDTFPTLPVAMATAPEIVKIHNLLIESCDALRAADENVEHLKFQMR